MPDMLPSATRRTVLAGSAAAGAASLVPAQASAATNSTAIPPFHIKISDEALIDLRKRIVATKFPEKGNGRGHNSGHTTRDCPETHEVSWSTEYDWRKCEAS